MKEIIERAAPIDDWQAHQIPKGDWYINMVMEGKDGKKFRVMADIVHVEEVSW